jgi:hypothetical protein
MTKLKRNKNFEQLNQVKAEIFEIVFVDRPEKKADDDVGIPVDLHSDVFPPLDPGSSRMLVFL